MAVPWYLSVLSLVGLWFYVRDTRKFWFKTSQKTRPQVRVAFDRLGEPEIELGTPGYNVSGLAALMLGVLVPYLVNTALFFN